MPWNAEEFRAPGLLPFVKAGQQFLHVTAGLQTHSMRALLRYQIEGVSFLKRRFEADLGLIETLTASNEFVDAFDVFVNFAQNATSDYANEVGKLASIGANLGSEAAGRVRMEAEVAIDDMTAATVAI